MNNNKTSLSHVLWIGGPANSGKTALARCIAKMKGYQRYSADKTGRDHLQKLAQINTKYEKYIESVLAERWAGYTAREIADQTLAVARERFQFVVQDLKKLSTHTPIIAEGVGFTPEIIQSVMQSPYQGIWLMPTNAFMEKSFRKKVRFLKARLGNQAETTINILLQANIHLMEMIQSEAEHCGRTVYKIDETKTVTENAAAVWTHFRQHVNRRA